MAPATITWHDLRDRSAAVVLGKTFADANITGIAIKAKCRPLALDKPVAGSMDSAKASPNGACGIKPRDESSLDLGVDADPKGGR